MEEKNVLHKNDGSSLILVIVCISFIGILCTILMTATVSNLEMKSINRNSKSNFYETETALDEIKTGLEEVAANSLETAYNNTMKQFLSYDSLSNQYIPKTEDEKKQIFRDTYINELTKNITELSDNTKYDITKLNTYLKLSNAIIIIATGMNDYSIDTTDITKPFVTLKNIKVSFTDTNDYNTTITTDISIHTPDLSFDSVSSNTPIEFSKYGLIADHRISLFGAQNVMIDGNVYAGENGISVTNESTVQLGNATDIVTRGDLLVEGRSHMTVIDNPKVWVRNIETGKGLDTLEETKLYLNGTCYVADDMMLNAKNSNVTINGEYYGYNYYPNTSLLSPMTDQAKNSSAIILNGINSSLDMSGVSKLLIAGRAYLNPNSRGIEYSGEKIPTGESLAVKGSQYAYLVPEECMWCETNPVMESVYKGRESNIQEVDFSKYTGISNINDYVDGYSKVFYTPNVSGMEGQVYYYLKFRSEEKANEYLAKYHEIHNTGLNTGIIDNRVGKYAKSIQIANTTSLISASNVFTFDEDTKKSLLKKNNAIYDGMNNALATGLNQMSNNLAKRYDGMQTYLKEFPANAPYDKNSLFHSIIDIEKIATDTLAGNVFDVNGIKCITVDSDNVVYIVDNKSSGIVFDIPTDSSLPNNGRQGIVLATGAVNLSGNYTGLILSGDTITLKSGAIITASDSVIKTIFAANISDINQYFRGYTNIAAGAGAGSSDLQNVSVSDLIFYDNWRKNQN